MASTCFATKTRWARRQLAAAGLEVGCFGEMKGRS
jgi:hypothetical protein